MARDSVGTVLSITGRGVLVRAPRMVPIGTKLVDARHQPVGRVVDVLGPVQSPYLLLSPPKGKPNARIGRDVYVP